MNSLIEGVMTKMTDDLDHSKEVKMSEGSFERIIIFSSADDS